MSRDIPDCFFLSWDLLKCTCSLFVLSDSLFIIFKNFWDTAYILTLHFTFGCLFVLSPSRDCKFLLVPSIERKIPLKPIPLWVLRTGKYWVSSTDLLILWIPVVYGGFNHVEIISLSSAKDDSIIFCYMPNDFVPCNIWTTSFQTSINYSISLKYCDSVK